MNLPPDPEKEYVLVYDCVDYSGGTFSDDKETIPKDTVVTNVRFKGEPNFMGDMLQFTVKSSGKVCETHYGYMFADNTPENLFQLEVFRDKQAAVREAERDRNQAKQRLATVRGPFEDSTGR